MVPTPGSLALVRTFLFAATCFGGVVLVTGCPGLQGAMNDLNKPAPSYVGTSSSSGGSSGGASATLADGGPAGSCEASCLHYLACKQLGNGEHQAGCVKRCAELKKTPDELARYEATDCATAISLVDGPSLGPGLPSSGVARASASSTTSSGCPAPMPPPRSPNDEKIFQVATTKTFCGWTYDKNTGTSRELRLHFQPDGTMVHQHKTERSGNTTDGWGTVTGSFGVVNTSGDKYCWKYAQGVMLYSSDGVTFSPFVNKVENNGAGVIFFQTRLGEYKICE